MKLRDVLDGISSTSDDMVVFARKPWTLESDAEIGSFDENARVPSEVKNKGLDYFLEVHVANEVLEVFGERKPSIEAQRALLMHYAEHDAYPEWVYES